MPLPDPPGAELSRLVREAQASERIPSISAAAVGSGELVWQEALGLASVEPEEEGTPDTQYRIGSLTKTFTAAAVMQLRDAGRLSLDDRLEQHLPEAHHGTLTLRRMLAHLSGLQREMPGYVWETLEFPDRAGLVSGLVDAEQVLPAGARWHYSNLAFALLGEVVARRSGLEYEDYVRERLLKPLGLNRTWFDPVAPTANAYFVGPYADRVRRERNVIKGAFAAAGSLWSTTADLGCCAKATGSWSDTAVPCPASSHVSPSRRRSARERSCSSTPVRASRSKSSRGSSRSPRPRRTRPSPTRGDPSTASRPSSSRCSAAGGPKERSSSSGIATASSRRARRTPRRPRHPRSSSRTARTAFAVCRGRRQGEPLEVVRGSDGAVEKLYWATYPMTRKPQSFSG